MDLKRVLRTIINEEFNRADYLKWKRNNVSYRGMKIKGEENGGSAILGAGLYSAALSNKSMARGYGELYFAVNAVPKHPKIFNTLNEWEIWFYNKLVVEFSKAEGKTFPDKRDFYAKTTIEDEMQKLGFDGIIIKGREMVNYKPENVKYFKTEDEVKTYYLSTLNHIYTQNENLNKIINEELENLNKDFYHGTRTPLPFQQFDPKLIGSGIVSSSRPEYGGFFFTDNKENAEFYTEYFIATVKIDNLIPVGSKNPPLLMKQAVTDSKNYLSSDVLDGAVHSDVAVVPSQNINNIHITNWEFVGDQESYFEQLDKIFNGDEDDYVNQDIINDTLYMIEMDVNYLLKIPIFKAYYESK